jgi:mono/diheme cytochrome c family protein
MIKKMTALLATVVLGSLVSFTPAIAASTSAAHGQEAKNEAKGDDDIGQPKLVSNPFAGNAEIVPAGKTLFNVNCSHCHGPNAFQGERVRDLRRLKRRYRKKIEAAFITTAWNGRAEKGMPPWGGILPEEDLWKIFTFLQTVQKK